MIEHLQFGCRGGACFNTSLEVWKRDLDIVVDGIPFSRFNTSLEVWKRRRFRMVVCPVQEFQYFLRGMETRPQEHRLLRRQFCFNTSLEVWKPPATTVFKRERSGFNTSLEVWKQPSSVSFRKAYCSFNTSLEVWKRNPDPDNIREEYQFQYFLRGMETHKASS
ncbi:hypothetical protein Mc24_02148 [Thermotoga sp. Mc24]|nr:hypothetical protein Mc24_02148 [Thermotoga sp. Mc24]